MHTTSSVPSPRAGLRLPGRSWILPALFALAALALPTRAAANPFAATSLTPSAPAAVVGTTFSVDVVFAVPAGGYSAYGLQAWLKFDAAKLQVVSVTTGAASPFTSVFTNQFDNANGTLTYGATGGSVSNATFTAATIVFQPTAAGTSALQFQNVNEYIVGYGPFGVNGLASGGSVTITAPAPTQTLTILGGSGSVGDFAPNTEYYNPDTQTWQPAYLTGWHPWGFVSGTNSWINYKPSSASDPDVSTDRNNPSWYLYRVRFTAPASYSNPRMTFSLKADNLAEVAVNGVSTGSLIEGAADQQNADAVFAQNLQPGENIITLMVGDHGGLNGFNFRIDLSVDSEEPLELEPAGPPPDTVAPVIASPGDLTAEATSPSGASVSFTATASDNVDGSVAVIASPASGSTFALGTSIVGLAASDAAGNTATASFSITVQDTTAPAITAPADITVEATSAAGATVTYAPATATDAVGVTSLAYSAESGSTFPLGVTTVGVTAGDAAGNVGTASFNVTVQDTTAPSLGNVAPSIGTLWSPNHKLVPITISADAADVVDVVSLKIISVTSNEPDYAPSLVDDDVAGDSQITGPLTLNLRSERSGQGDGRIYTITVEARDAAGNATTATTTVTVPHDQSAKAGAKKGKGK